MISREGAVEYFVYCLTELKMDTEAIREAHELAIEALSQPERPKGQWEVIGKTENGANILQCSNCKRIRRGSVKSAFCRDCGADMRKEK